MDFHISEESRKKLDDMIYGHIKRQQEMDEQKKEEEKRKRLEHLETYHFKSFDEILEYLKGGKKIYTDKTFTDRCCKHVKYNDGNLDYWFSDDVVYVYTPEEFKDKFLFSLLPGSTGYIDCWHKEN